jgi:gamma-glutamyl hydrolase
MFEALTTKAPLYFNHVWGVDTKTYLNNEKLLEAYSVLSYSADRQGRAFVAWVESRDYPIYGVQFHPEKTAFEWKIQKAINHAGAAIKVTQNIGNFFVDEARKNNNTFSNPEEEDKALIYNYNPVRIEGGFMQVYFLNNVNVTHTEAFLA